MSKVNAGRMLLGGLVAGVIYDLAGFLTDGVALKENWTAATQTLGVAALGQGALLWETAHGLDPWDCGGLAVRGAGVAVRRQGADSCACWSDGLVDRGTAADCELRAVDGLLCRSFGAALVIGWFGFDRPGGGNRGRRGAFPAVRQLDSNTPR